MTPLPRGTCPVCGRSGRKAGVDSIGSDGDTAHMDISCQQPRTVLVTLQEAARDLRVSTRTLGRMATRGEITLVRVGPKLLRVPRSEIERLTQNVERPAGARRESKR